MARTCDSLLSFEITCQNKNLFWTLNMLSMAKGNRMFALTLTSFDLRYITKYINTHTLDICLKHKYTQNI